MSMSTATVGLRLCRNRMNLLIRLPTRPQAAPHSFGRMVAPSKLAAQFRPLSTKPSTSCTIYSTIIRRASTVSSSVRGNPAQPVSATILDWNTFFRLRTSRRRYSLASSIVSSIAVTYAAFVFLSTQPEMADELTKLVPMDPVISMGLITFAASLLGWLIGPAFGSAVWKLLHRSRLSEFTVKERTFFDRIKRHRVNPQGASTNNPVPDYYGEKIGSVGGYRRWLKDQRAFNRKKEGSYAGGI